MMNPPVSSRAALAEIERQRPRVTPNPIDTGTAERSEVVAAEKSGGSGRGAGGEPKKKGGSSKGSGRKEEVQRNPEDQKGRADPKEGQGRGAE